MSENSKNSRLHCRNKHQGAYDFDALIKAHPPLLQYVIDSPLANGVRAKTIDFASSTAVKVLNQALMSMFYGVAFWDFPDNYLCPPIPGRADYIHNIADYLAKYNDNSVPKGKRVRLLDVGTGANCIYPILGTCEYDWQFVASDIDPISVETARTIVKYNKKLNTKIDCRLQTSAKHYFSNIVKSNEQFDFTLCNPPFHRSLDEAMKGNERKRNNLKLNRSKRNASKHMPKQGIDEAKPSTALNFAGQKAELWCDGGELKFITGLIYESKHYATQIMCFSSFVSKSSHLNALKAQLTKVGAKSVDVLEMRQGQKVSRTLVWSFLDEAEKQAWASQKWS